MFETGPAVLIRKTQSFQCQINGAYHREMRHVSAALGSSLGPLIGSSTGWVNVLDLPTLGHSWPRLRPPAHQATVDGVDMIDLQPTDSQVARLRPEVTRVRRS